MIPGLGGITSMRVDPAATFAPTQHALAGKAALGLAQLTEKDSHVLAKVPEDMLEYVAHVNEIAQKADITRKVLERYLFGTEITRIDPVMVPYTPESISTYTVPSGDPDVYQNEHISFKAPVPLRNIGNMNTASFKNPVRTAGCDISILQTASIFGKNIDRELQIKNFI